MGLEGILATTNCQKNCIYSKYSLADFASSKTFANYSLIILVPDNANAILETEYPLYGMEDFLADFGSYMGLLLGASILTVFDIVTGN